MQLKNRSISHCSGPEQSLKTVGKLQANIWRVISPAEHRTGTDGVWRHCPQHWVSLLSISCCLWSLYSIAFPPWLTLLSVRSSKERWADLAGGPNASSRASSSRCESKLGSSWMVAMRGLSREGRWVGIGSRAEMDTRGVLDCWGPDGWKRSPAGLVVLGKGGGLKIRTDADSRLLRSSAFWEN